MSSLSSSAFVTVLVCAAAGAARPGGVVVLGRCRAVKTDVLTETVASAGPPERDCAGVDLGLTTIRLRLRVEVPQAVRVVIAAGVSWQLCMWILNGPHGHPPVYAAVVPLVAMRDHPYSAFNVSLDRLVGVL